MGDRGPGVATAFELPEGPATLISLTPLHHTGGWVLVGAEGRIIGSKHHAMEGPNGMFRFDSGQVADAFARWCEAGATHHAGVLPGRHGDVLRRTAKILGIDYAGRLTWGFREAGGSITLYTTGVSSRLSAEPDR